MQHKATLYRQHSTRRQQQPRSFTHPLLQYMHHHCPIIGEEHPNTKEAEGADVDADLARVEGDVGATVQCLRHSHLSRMRAEQGASHHLEVGVTSYHCRGTAAGTPAAAGVQI